MATHKSPIFSIVSVVATPAQVLASTAHGACTDALDSTMDLIEHISAQGAYCPITLLRPIIWYYDQLERAGRINLSGGRSAPERERYDG